MVFSPRRPMAGRAKCVFSRSLEANFFRGGGLSGTSALKHSEKLCAKLRVDRFQNWALWPIKRAHARMQALYSAKHDGRTRLEGIQGKADKHSVKLNDLAPNARIGAKFAA